MKDLFKISLIISLIGIFLLLLLSNILGPKLTDIKDIDIGFLNKNVKVHGQILNIRTYENSDFQVISIKDDTGKIDVTTDKILNLTNNKKIIVIGTVNEYKQYLQIRADKIIKK